MAAPNDSSPDPTPDPSQPGAFDRPRDTVMDDAIALTRASGRRAAGRFLAEGPHVVRDALAARAAVEQVFVAYDAAERPEIVELMHRAALVKARILRVAVRQLARLADTETPQGVVAVVKMPELPATPLARPGLWVLLDGVQDPGNVGTLLRSADAFGANGVIAGPGTADLWSGKVLRSAQGASFRLTLISAASDAELTAHLDTFTSSGGQIWAATMDGESVYAAPVPPNRTLVALGSEARGVSSAVLARAARKVTVPQRGLTESLNVAMAGSILLSWLAERRG